MSSATGVAAHAPLPAFRTGACCDARKVDFVGAVGCPAEKWCERPNTVVCLGGCGWWKDIPCESTKASKCRPCARRYRKRVEKLALQALMLQAPGTWGVLTLTAPGMAVHCRHRGHGNCDASGPDCERCPCTDEGGTDVGEWNCVAGALFNRLMTAIKRGEASPREAKRRGRRGRRGRQRRRVTVPNLVYFRAIEVQDRGALHFHVILARTDNRPLKLRESALRRLAMKRHAALGGACFGHSLVWDSQASMKGTAKYVAKYVAKTAEQREEVPWAMGRLENGSMMAPRFRCYSKSLGWMQTMANVRLGLPAGQRRAGQGAGGAGAPFNSSLCSGYAGMQSLEHVDRAVSLLRDAFGLDPPPPPRATVPPAPVNLQQALWSAPDVGQVTPWWLVPGEDHD